ncbi:HERC2, partial [Symbiodinium necroappetens]
HTWTADSWLKHAAICLHLNFKLALGIAISAWISVIGYIAITGLTSWGGCHFLVVAGVYVPTLLFFLVVFYGHRLSSLLHEQPTVWLDKVCIHQTDEAMKAQQVKALPVFVARSREMLVLWSQCCTGGYWPWAWKFLGFRV